MSIRKYLIQDFRPFVEMLKTNGFEYIEIYRKAEALVGETNSLALINLYFKDENRCKEMMRYDKFDSHRAHFLETLKFEAQTYPFTEAFDRTVKWLTEKKIIFGT